MMLNQFHVEEPLDLNAWETRVKRWNVSDNLRPVILSLIERIRQAESLTHKVLLRAEEAEKKLNSALLALEAERTTHRLDNEYFIGKRLDEKFSGVNHAPGRCDCHTNSGSFEGLK